MRGAKIEETVCNDRISELPEELLVKILSLVPTKDAVATMFLSKRWFSIWTMVGTLKYKDREEDDDDESKKSVWWFLDKSLQSHKAHVIDYLRMKLGPRCPNDADVGKWVAKAVDRRVVNLNLNLRLGDPTSLPMSLYTCKTLKELTLFHKILVDFPSSSCLPSLLKLRLAFVVYKDEASLVRFLSSCPVLEALAVQRNKDDNVKKFSVKVPSLLNFYYASMQDHDNDVVDTERCLVMDTPILREFFIGDFSGYSWSVENMPFLKKASIFNVESSLFFSYKFNRCVSKVMSLDLYFSNEVVKLCSTINFSLLKMLRVFLNDSDWLEPLMLFLENVPNLKKLMVNCEYYSEPENLPVSWTKPSSVPKCLSSQLEIFEWIEYGNRIEEEEFLTYVLANSKCLKTATISLRSTVDILEEQDFIFEVLNDIPRVSKASQLLLK